MLDPDGLRTIHRHNDMFVQEKPGYVLALMAVFMIIGSFL